MKLLRVRTLLTGIILLAATTVPAYAQADPEIVIRQGDSIEWTGGSGVHRLNFGATGTTPVADIGAILEFKPTLVPNPMNPAEHESGTLSGVVQAALVKEDKATVGKTFVFTCGIHRTAMVSVAFRVAPKDSAQKPRTYRIMGEVGGGFQWHLHVDTTVKQ